MQHFTYGMRGEIKPSTKCSDSADQASSEVVTITEVISCNNA